MTMSKRQLREWPWNNRPSQRHAWKSAGDNDKCDRCGCVYIRVLGGSGDVYCFPKPDWLAAHPNDDGKLG